MGHFQKVTKVAKSTGGNLKQSKAVEGLKTDDKGINANRNNVNRFN